MALPAAPTAFYMETGSRFYEYNRDPRNSILSKPPF